MDSTQSHEKPQGIRSAFNLRVSLLLLLQLLSGIVSAPCSTFLPVYLNELGRTAVFISMVFSVQRIVALGSSLVGGTLSDFLSRKQALLLGQAGLVAATMVFVSPFSAVIIVLWSLNGFGVSLNTLGGQSYLLDNANHTHLGMITAFYFWGYTLGAAIGNPLAGVLLGKTGYVALGVSLAGLGLLTLGVTARLLPASSNDENRAGRRDQDAPDSAQHTETRGSGTSPRKSGLFGYGELALRPAVLLLAFLRFLPTFCYGMMTIFIPLLLIRAEATTGIIALYATTSSLCAALAQLAVGRIADKTGPKWPSVTAYTVLLSSSACVGVFSERLWSVFFFGVVGIAAAWSLSVLLSPLVARATEASERGRVLGFIHLFWNAAMILGSLVGGVLYEVWTGLPFIVGAAAVVACPPLVIVFFRLVRAERKRQE